MNAGMGAAVVTLIALFKIIHFELGQIDGYKELL
jgi:hypothetical protein